MNAIQKIKVCQVQVVDDGEILETVAADVVEDEHGDLQEVLPVVSDGNGRVFDFFLGRWVYPED